MGGDGRRWEEMGGGRRRWEGRGWVRSGTGWERRGDTCVWLVAAWLCWRRFCGKERVVGACPAGRERGILPYPSVFEGCSPFAIMSQLSPPVVLSLFFLLGGTVASAQLVINEFMANNLSSVDVDEDTQHEDWIEIQNNGSSAASLNGWYLTDDAGELRKWQFPVGAPAVSVAAGGRLVVWASGKNRRAVATKLHTNFKLSSQGEFLALVAPDGASVADSYSPAYPAQFPNGTYGRVPVVATRVLLPEGSRGRALAPLSEADFAARFAGWNSALALDDSAWQEGTVGFGFGSPFEDLIGPGGDLSAMMKGVTPACFIRYRFDYAASDPVTALRVKTKFDDGYACFLNGTLVGSSGVPTPLAWNSAATGERVDSLALTAVAVVPANGGALLLPGSNLLAVALLNTAATEVSGTPPVDRTNVLLRTQVEVDVRTGYENGYLTSATRGAVNSGVKVAVGPFISQTTDRPAQPVGGVNSAPLLITAAVGTTLRPLAEVAPVTLRWRRMYAAENTVVMVDDGTLGDAVGGDGVYTGSVPTASLLPGEMIRWRIVAKDNNATPIYAYDPPYLGFSATAPPGTLPTVSPTIEAEQYYGTMALPALVGNPGLPVLYWFINGADNSGTDSGTRGSFFWQPLPKDQPPMGYVPPKPRFYDNVLANLHGQSSAGFPKKSHDLSFAKDNRFLWKDGTPETSGLNLLGNYADKSKVRNPTAWWVWEKSGHLASHYDTPVRVQQNNVFKGIYDLVENANSAWLEREGLDPAGTLYKMYNSLDAASSPGAEKKNPDDTNTADLNALINGLAPSQSLTARLRYLYDNVNVAALINCLATHSLILNRDFGHKNFYMFRDSNGTLEWSILPWDQDLSQGHTWTGAQNYFDDDMHSQAALQIGVTNRLIEMAYATPELNSMFVRRLRSLADQFFVSATEANGPMAQHINALIAQIDPDPNNTAAGTDDADLEAKAWGFWMDGSSNKIPYTDSRMAYNTARVQAARITTANPIPPNPGGPAYDDGTTTLLPFLPGRRALFYGSPAPTSPGLNGITLASQTFPGGQPLAPDLVIEQVTPAPTTGVYQNQEYFVLRNPNLYAVDLSGWQLGGDIAMTFQGGTVIPALGTKTTQTANAAYVNQLVVANRPQGIRTRSSSPMASQYRQVAGPYEHQLSARGGVITLSRPNDALDARAGYTLVQSISYSGTPTASQEALRISELHFRPAAATAAELAVLPGLVSGDFEFMELVNDGPNTLELGKAYFEEGVEFTFPAPFALNPGERCLVVASQAAFQIRYGESHRIAGEFQGSLDNGGEKLRLLDTFGEPVLEFSYDDDWYPVPVGQSRSLVVRQPMPAYGDFGKPGSWQLSSQPNGSPGAGDGVAAVVFEGWRYDYFSAAELPTALAPDLPAAPEADPDHDGWRNFEEYAFGSVPTSAASRVQVVGGSQQVGADSFLTLSFTRPAQAIDLRYAVECSGDLEAAVWREEAVAVGAAEPLPGGLERVTYRDTVPMGGQGKRFMRARARK